MDRRDFLTRNFVTRQSSLKPQPIELSADLSTYEQVLDKSKAAHLLRRISLGPTMELINLLEGKNAEEAVDLILGTENDPLNSGEDKLNWLQVQEEDPLDGLPLDIRFEIEGRMTSQYRQFVNWWLDTMRAENNHHQEKLTLFLSAIWCIEFEYDTLSLIPPPLLYKNNMTLRKYRLGNYKELAFEMTLDGAMLMYQSLNYSTAKAPNENFMRELLELFTMGIGNYSEGDIREGARTLTGWRVASYKYKPAPNGIFNTYFSPADHDTQSKQIMGNTISARSEFDNSEYQVKEQEVRKLIDIIFSERANQIARFVCEKIYKYFVYSSPSDVPEVIISELSEVFISNNFNLRPVYKKLFTSKHFFSDEIIGAQIKTPPELVIGLQRALNTIYKQGNTLLSAEACSRLEMELYNPPNVGSWTGYRTWISTTTYPLRVLYSNEILDSKDDADLIKLIRTFPEFTSLDNIINLLLLLLVPVQVDEERLEFHRSVVIQSLDGSNWASEIESGSKKSADAIRELIKSMILIPDFYLC
ncbi:MAG: DUF1800 family protein [Candidatus Kapaibacterium sp.]|jgi:hypothetical protein